MTEMKVLCCQFLVLALSHGSLGNLGKMAPSTIQKIKASITGQEPDDGSLITEVQRVI